MKNVKAFRRLVTQGLSEALARKTVRDIRDLGYSPESITQKYPASEILDIIQSVERALDYHFEKEKKNGNL